MIARVVPIRRLPKGHQSFDYGIPESLAIKAGDLVEIPLRGTPHLGVVIELVEESPFKITASISSLTMSGLFNVADLERLKRIAAATGSTVGHLLATFLPAQNNVRRSKKSSKSLAKLRVPGLNPSSAAELGKIFTHLRTHDVASVACHRTLATFAALKIASAKQPGEQILFLLPQAREAELLSRALSLPHRLFTGTTPDAERIELCEAWRTGSGEILISTRAGSLLPPKSLRTIVVLEASNEEHENTRRNPRFDAREAAWLLQAQTGARLFFFDDLPRLEEVVRAPLYMSASVTNANLAVNDETIGLSTDESIANEDELATYLEEAPTTDSEETIKGPRNEAVDAPTPYALRADAKPEAVAAAPMLLPTTLPPSTPTPYTPSLHLHDLTRSDYKTATPYLSFPLIEDIKNALQSQKNVLLFYNRKGVGAHYKCRACEQIPRCGNCGTVPLPRGEDLLCPHCNTEMWVPKVCPSCGKAKLALVRMGKATVAKSLESLLPGAAVLSIEKGLKTILPAYPHIAIATDYFFTAYDAHFPTERFSLIADLSFDLTLVHDNVRATEEAARRLTRLKGLGERLNATCYVSTYMPDLVTKLVDLPAFLKSEMALREDYGLPPYTNEVIVEKLTDEDPTPPGFVRHGKQAIGYNVIAPVNSTYRYHGPY